MKVLSLFDGISIGKLALNRLHIPHAYHAIEIDKHARAISDYNHPDIVRPAHDVRGFQPLQGYDLVIGGSPCQDISSSNHGGKGLDGKKSSLFWEYVRILEAVKELNPNAVFLLENVKNRNADIDRISEALGVEGVYINSRAFLIQNRPRIYWSNQHIPTEGLDNRRKWAVNAPYALWRAYNRKRFDVYDGVAPCVTAFSGCRLKALGAIRQITDKTFNPHDKHTEGQRRLTLNELEALQGYPAGYTTAVNHVSEQQRGKAIGNGWTLPVIEYIFQHIL